MEQRSLRRFPGIFLPKLTSLTPPNLPLVKGGAAGGGVCSYLKISLESFLFIHPSSLYFTTAGLMADGRRSITWSISP
jgi:hypothetical protein